MKPNTVSATRSAADYRRRFVEFVREVSPQADPLSVLLFGQVLRASSRLVHAAEKDLASSNLTWAKFRLLMSLLHAERHGSGGMQPSALSEAQGISRNTASALIRSLESSEMVSRELHSSDRRKFLIHLTPRGRSMLHDLFAGHFKFVAHCFDALSAPEREQLNHLLSRLNDNLGDR